MPDDYKYTLTRICLRTGQLSLTYRMMSLFPETGSVTALDAEKNSEFQLTMEAKRRVSGISKFIQTHNLEVNDEIHIQKLQEGQYSLTPFKRSQLTQKSKDANKSQLLEQLTFQATPMSESEIRTALPDLTKGLDVAEALAQDNRFIYKSGRWQLANWQEQDVPEQEAQDFQLLNEDNKNETSEEAPRIESTQVTARVSERRINRPPAIKPINMSNQEARIPLQRDSEPSEAINTQQPRQVTSYVREPQKIENTNSIPENLEDHNKAKDLLKLFGYRVESISNGQMIAYAELGRHAYSVLIQVLSEGQSMQLDKLLAMRREADTTYAAIFADHRELIRLGATPSGGRATLWSWSGLARVKDLMQVVPVSPYDLESHFVKDGLFEHGKDRFEKEIGDRISERGVFSSVLSRLARMNAPCIFVLDDAVDDQLSRDQVVKVLDNLSGAPFHMIAKVGNGEFCLRYKVADSLEQISRYALSLRDRLPNSKTERFHAFDDAEILQ